VNTKRLAWTGLVTGLVLLFAASGFAQVQSGNRIPQQVIINGQRVNGAYVSRADGGLQTFTCPSPQSYNTPEGATQGWACFEQATGVWLLNALPPSPPPVQQAPAPVVQQQPPVIYQQPATVIYQQPYPATVVYTTPAPVIVAPAYPPSVVLSAAAINATGRIVSAALLGHRYYSGPRYTRDYYVVRGHRRW
jgi:hypothetical protein